MAVSVGKEAFKKCVVLALTNAVDQLKAEFRDLLFSEQRRPVEWTISWIRGLSDIPLPEDIIEDNKYRTVITTYTSHGVVGAIVSSNFPLMHAATKIAPALLMGNGLYPYPVQASDTIPSNHLSPYCGLRLVGLAHEDDNLGPWLTSYPRIDRIIVTGSTITEQASSKSASKTLKGLLLSCEFWGLICLNIKRIYVHEFVSEEFKDAVVYCKINDSDGSFITSTVIDRPPENSRIDAHCTALSWKSEDEVIARGNDTLMGLGASVWTNGLKKAERVARQMQAAGVWVNTHFSGFGTEWNSLKAFCNVQTLSLNKQ
ncbi:Aldehyde/histidinol dehydrogenase [Talaromyces proteolyticus]|uniref:aldehyde dehydrogenase (NAD(+)) n=1 Tax=Talaromyces proteolyticus TaxID=1131652 RepID=A0AAD4PWI8_9EURO|nr:Aldehyde/histidinol dehydrogenase [Talaromyces proteolyticus]KAH8691569.1 Aldehyde/histidinol dehydrogenase [Talaromyces proteolyticus]